MNARLLALVCIGVFPLAQSAWGQTATVSTMAQLRSAIADNTITTININPGTYLLTSSGSGQLEIQRNLTITNTGGGRVVIDGNNASRVFYVNGVTATMTGLTITRGNGNGGSEGGGIYVNSGTVRLIRSTVSGNTTSGSKPGGGIWANSSTLELINSTVSGNTASGAQGGGVYGNGGSILVSNSSIASNSASSGGGIYRNSTSLTLRNSIVADNTGGQIAGSGTITSNGKNLVEGGCTGCSGSDLTADPKLDALANNGGDSYTHALLAASPALNAASNTDAQATDQRGRARPQGTTADMGAFESGADLAVTKGVSNSTPSEGAAISYTVTVSGAGPDGATSVTVTDLLPAGVSYQSYTATQGSYVSGTGVWTVGSVASGASVTLTLNVSVNSGTSGSTITNTASITSLNEAESSTANNSASRAITVAAITVAVTPDGSQNLERLPSNGTNYTATFTVTNSGGSPADFDLLAARSPGTAIGIVSVNGAAGDSTRITGLGAGASQSIAVVYSVGAVAAGVRDTLRLRARSVSAGANTDSGYADLTVVRPSLTVAKTVVPPGVSAPGTELTYAVTITNGGTSGAASVVIVDTLPAAVQFKIGSVVNSMPAGVSVTVDYSNDGGTSWTYVPASGACGAPAGYDACVNRIRWRLLNDLSATAPDNAASVSFSSRIR